MPDAVDPQQPEAASKRLIAIGWDDSEAPFVWVDARTKGSAPAVVVENALDAVDKPLRRLIGLIWCNSAVLWDYTVVLQAGTVQDIGRIGQALETALIAYGGHDGFVVGYQERLQAWPATANVSDQ